MWECFFPQLESLKTPPMQHTHNMIWQWLFPQLRPIRLKIRSLVTRIAISPPFCNATAPTIAYKAWARATSDPDLGRSQAYRKYISPEHIHNSLKIMETTYCFRLPSQHIQETILFCNLSYPSLTFCVLSDIFCQL